MIVMIGIVDQLREDHEYFYLVCMVVDMKLREGYGPTMIHADSQVDDQRMLEVLSHDYCSY